MRALGSRSRGLVLGGLRLRWRTRRQAYDLDRLLAGGEDPIESDALSLRAGQLGAARNRHRLACMLRGAVRVAASGSEPLIGTARPRTEVRAHSALLQKLAEALDSGRPLGVEGLARVSLLVNDALSPRCHSDAPCSLACAVSEALDALERGQLTASLTGR